MKEDADLKAILALSVEKATPKLDGLVVAELRRLHELEHEGANRGTMLEAIDRERRGRDEDDAGGSEGGGAGEDGEASGVSDAAASADAGTVTAAWPPAVVVRLGDAAAVYGASIDFEDDADTIVDKVLAVMQSLSSDADDARRERDRFEERCDGAEDELNSLRDRVFQLEMAAVDADDPDDDVPTFTQVQVDALLSQQRDAMIEVADKRVEEARQAATAPAMTKRAAGKPLRVAAGAPPLSALAEHASHVVLTDEDDVAIDELPALVFDTAAFRIDASGAVLTRPIAMPAGMPERRVAGAFVLIDRKPVAKATLVSTFAVGGGRTAQLPAGTLSFDRVPVEAPAEVTAS